MTENKENKVLGYIRVSTESQEENTSLKVQRDSIKNYCKSRGWNLVEIYEDVSSGGNTDREGYKEMERKLDENGFNFLVCDAIGVICNRIFYAFN